MTELTTWEEWRKIYPAFIGPKPPQHCMSFPGCCHHEENRQNAINVENYKRRLGWLPCGDNWWRFPAKNLEHNHIDLSSVTIYVKQPDGSTKKLVTE
jgi:hypothetical protein